MLFTATAFTAGNVKIQVTERKHVINRELWVALQFPIGDDVSALNPLQSSVPFVFNYTEADEADRRSSLRYCAEND
jgi:predicted ATPase